MVVEQLTLSQIHTLSIELQDMIKLGCITFTRCPLPFPSLIWDPSHRNLLLINSLWVVVIDGLENHDSICLSIVHLEHIGLFGLAKPLAMLVRYQLIRIHCHQMRKPLLPMCSVV